MPCSCHDSILGWLAALLRCIPVVAHAARGQEATNGHFDDLLAAGSSNLSLGVARTLRTAWTLPSGITPERSPSHSLDVDRGRRHSTRAAARSRPQGCRLLPRFWRRFQRPPREARRAGCGGHGTTHRGGRFAQRLSVGLLLFDPVHQSARFGAGSIAPPPWPSGVKLAA